MEPIVVAVITGMVSLVGVILSNSKGRAVMAVKLDSLTAKVEKHNRVLERTYRPGPQGEGGMTWASSWQATTGSGGSCARWRRACWAWWSRTWT